MLQDFRRRTTPDTGSARLRDLRAAMEAEGVAAFLAPRADAHQGENVAARDERLSWLTGFTGSAGLAVITTDRAGLFVDGRYRLQVRSEVDLSQFTILNVPEDKPGAWMAEVMVGGGSAGFDPWLHTASEIETLSGFLGPRQISLRRVPNLIDRVWADQPPPPAALIVPHPATLAGRSALEKRADLGQVLMAKDLAAAVLTLPDSIAWLLNIRGSDIPRTPVPLVFAILHADGGVDLFLDPVRVDPDLAQHLGDGVRVFAPGEFGAHLDALGGRIGVDKSSAPVWVSDRIKAAEVGEVVWTPDPCILPKATKTEAEIAGARSAHLRDGAAMVEFLTWLDAAAPVGNLTEIDVVRRLQACREATGVLRDISFETICGSGPNGAIVHYRVTEASNRAVSPGDVLLIDSGGQYSDGTTDITRTVATGAPPPEAVTAFTLVLKGLIAMSQLVWPVGLAGRDIDSTARAAMWRGGLDYDHGTGHGVGSYLGVHEGPAGLSRRSTEVIQPGMIISIEPGYYREGAFGIRIENLAVVRDAAIPECGDRPMLSWETLTLAPIDRRLVAHHLLDPAERDWLDAYHARVAETLAPLVTPSAATWLKTACAPFQKDARQ